MTPQEEFFSKGGKTFAVSASRRTVAVSLRNLIFFTTGILCGSIVTGSMMLHRDHAAQIDAVQNSSSSALPAVVTARAPQHRCILTDGTVLVYTQSMDAGETYCFWLPSGKTTSVMKTAISRFEHD